MTFAFIREGDSTDHGGTVLSSDAITTVNGVRIAFVGTMVSCPKCKGVFPIVTTKNPGMSFGGNKNAAFEGDKTACGATLISSQTLTKANVPVGAGGIAGGTVTANHDTDSSTSKYRGRFQVLDRDGNAVPNHPYSLKTASGRTISGTTDSNGYTQWHEADEPGSLLFGHGGTEE